MACVASVIARATFLLIPLSDVRPSPPYRPPAGAGPDGVTMSAKAKHETASGSGKGRKGSGAAAKNAGGRRSDESARKVLVTHRKARRDYEILDTVEAGIVLQGTEVKSVRAGKLNLGDAYAVIENGEAWLVSLHISPYEQANQFNHEPLRKRKLLLHKRQIERLLSRVQERGLALVPLSVYLVANKVKVELGVGRGRKMFDKREAVAKRTAQREIDRAVKDRSR